MTSSKPATFGSRETPRFLYGQPGTRQVWSYRGFDVEITPRQIPGGRAWVAEPRDPTMGLYEDPQEALAHARFWLDVDDWTAAGTDEDRLLLIQRLLGMGREARTRDDLGRATALECKLARMQGFTDFLGVTLCNIFDGLPLANRQKLLDEVFKEADRNHRGMVMARRLQMAAPKPKLRKNPSRRDHRRLLHSLLRRL